VILIYTSVDQKRQTFHASSNIADHHQSLKKCCTSFESAWGRRSMQCLWMLIHLREVIVVCMTICHANEPSPHTAKQWDNAQSKISLEIKTNLLVSMETLCWHQHKRNQWLFVVDLARERGTPRADLQVGTSTPRTPVTR